MLTNLPCIRLLSTAVIVVSACDTPPWAAPGSGDRFRAVAPMDTGVDCNFSIPYWEDHDGDFVANLAYPIANPCTYEGLKAHSGDDCNDDEPLAWGGAPEVPCDGVDNDCDGFEPSCGDPIERTAATVNGEPGSLFGSDALWIGDVDGDGTDDVATTAIRGIDLEGSEEDAVFLVGGRSLVPGGSFEAGPPSIHGAVAGEWVGRLITPAFDTDGDGVLEFWAQTWNGTRILLEALALNANLDAAILEIDGSYPVGADLNSDGFSDVLMGMEGTSSSYVLFGPSTTWGLSVVEASSASFSWITCGALTSAAVLPGDLDGDGVQEIGLSGLCNEEGSGVAVFYDASATGAVEVVPEEAKAWLSDPGPQDLMEAGDVTGDGVVDLAVTAATHVSFLDGIRVAGVVTIDEIEVAEVDFPGEGYVRHLVPVGDVDQDGFEDVVVYRDSGQIQRIPGGLSGALTRDDLATTAWWDGTATGGSCLVSGGDFDGDGLQDVIVGHTVFDALWVLPGSSL